MTVFEDQRIVALLALIMQWYTGLRRRDSRGLGKAHLDGNQNPLSHFKIRRCGHQRPDGTLARDRSGQRHCAGT